MKRIGILGLVVGVVLGMSAVAISSPLTSPEWFQHGEAIEAAKTIKFTGKGGKAVLETVGKSKIRCKENNNAGEIEGPKDIRRLSVTYTGCEIVLGIKCATTGRAAGEIVTEKIAGELIYLDKEHTKAGVLLRPESGTTFASFECEGVAAEDSGDLIGQALPLGTESTGGELVLEQASGKQRWQQAEEESEPAKHLTAVIGTKTEEGGVGGGPSSEPLKEKTTFAEAVELHKS